MTTPEPGKGRGRWMRVLLLVSLALNLLIVGVVAGAILGRDGDRRGARGSMPSPLYRALDTEDRRDLLRELREAGFRNGSGTATRRRAGRLLEVLRQDTFDRDAFIAVLEEHRETTMAWQEAGATLIADHLAGKTPEERRAYADRLERRMRRGPRR